MSMEQWLSLVRDLGLPITMLLTAVLAFTKGWVVPRYVYQDAVQQRDNAINVLERAMTAAETAAKLAERVAGRPFRSRRSDG